MPHGFGLKVIQHLNQHKTEVLGAATIRDGRHTDLPTERLRLASGYVVQLVDQPGTVLAAIGHPDVLQVINRLEGLAFNATQYAAAKQNPTWQALYQVKKRPLYFLVNGAQAHGVAEDSAPCIYCGLLLPLRLITVDHQRPQAGGETEAVAKMFRTLGWTVAGPIGAKGQSFQSGHLTPVEPRVSRGVRTPTSTLGQRYTLNAVGTLWYSLAVAIGARAALEATCMHSLINLAPLCHGCNSSKNNQLKF